MKTVAEAWAHAVELLKLDAPGVSEVQRSEMRKAFYAGFGEAVNEFIETSNDDSVDEDDGARHFEALFQECGAFWKAEEQRFREAQH